MTAYDVVVVGAGAVGAATARALAGLDLRVALVEARSDVGAGTSKANTAILHTGFDATPGSLEATLVRRGYELLGAYAAQTGIPVERTGALLVAWTQEQVDTLPALDAKAKANGYARCELLDAEAVYAAVPDLGPGALAGLAVPGESILCPWSVVLALATDAVTRGVDLLLGTEVREVAPGEPTTLHTSRGPLQARWVVNAAGLGSDLVDQAFAHQRFTVTPRRGELLVYDKAARPMVPVIVLPVPSTLGKGVLVSPTIYGNVVLGPTAEDRTDRADTATSEAGLAFLLDKGRALMPALLDHEVTAAYAGLRAATESSDYQVHLDAGQRYLCLGGIRSTGITASMAIAEHALELLAGAGLAAPARADLPPPPQVPNLGEAFLRPYAQPELIAADPAYGQVVCFCERVTAGEVRDALASTIPPADLDGLRRRTRVTMGRCQGFYCTGTVTALLEQAGPR